MPSKSEGAVSKGDAFALRNAFRVSAYGWFGIGVPARESEDTAVHLERRGRARAAIVWRRRFRWDEVVEIERIAREQLGCACGEDLVAHPFALAEFRPLLTPVGFEAGDSADAFEFGDLLEQVREPGDEHGDRRELVARHRDYDSLTG